MAIILRDNKGTPLTHQELDTNFREFFYSGSVNHSEIKLFRSRSLNAAFSIPFTTPNGLDKYIQIRSGSDLSGSGAVFTGSQNFTFDYDNNVFEVTGSTNIKGNVDVDGALTAKTYITTTVSSSVIFESGSSQFGNSLDDTHTFTGSVNITGSTTQAGTIDATGATSKIRFLYDTTASLPNATDYHGMFAHVHAEGHAYYAHAGQWRALANSSSISLEIAALTGSFSSSVSTRITAQEAFSSSADTIFASNADINTATASLSSSIAVSIALNTLTGSNHETRIALNTLTGSNHETLITRNTLTGSNHETRIDTLEAINYISGSSAGTAQGQFKLNGVDVNVKDLQTTSNVTFGQITGSSALINGALSATGDITAFFSSDERLKDNITPIEGALDKINQIGGYGFDWNDKSEHTGHDIGVIAQEIEKVLPELVVDRDTGYKAVRYDKIVALLINAIKEQQLQINELKSRL